MTTPNKALTVSEYMRQPQQMERFIELLGKDAQPFVQSVLITVAGDDKLRECTPQSIFKSALRAATLELSCDPSTKQGWLVPYNKKVKTQQGDKCTKHEGDDEQPTHALSIACQQPSTRAMSHSIERGLPSR